MVDYLEIKSFVEPSACGALRAELREAAGAAASVLSRMPAAPSG